MNNKTAKLEIYHVWGTSNTIGVRLLYRGKTLVDFAGHNAEKETLIAKAHTWATNQGYTV
jgi:ATP-dependent protease HslVU (ClpYQ) peptidase subunit